MEKVRSFKILRRFNTWTAILQYMDEVDILFENQNVGYTIEVYFSEELQDYKVYLIAHESR